MAIIFSKNSHQKIDESFIHYADFAFRVRDFLSHHRPKVAVLDNNHPINKPVNIFLHKA